MAPRSSKRRRRQSSQSELGDGAPCHGSSDTSEVAESSPIERVPFEVLSEIFACNEVLFRVEQGPRVLTPWTPAYNLSRVNKRWRAVALGTPVLWTCMTIKGVRSKLRAEKWIEHAGEHPITLWALVKTPRSTDEFLERHASRIGDLCVTFPKREGYRTSVTKVSLTWPPSLSQITALDLQEVPLTYSQLTSVFQTAPRLERLVARIGQDCPAHTLVAPPHDHSNLPTSITYLDLNTGFENGTELYDLLRLCPHLEFLSLDPRGSILDDWYTAFDDVRDRSLSYDTEDDTSDVESPSSGEGRAPLPPSPSLPSAPHRRSPIDLPTLRAVAMPMFPFVKQVLPLLNAPAMELFLSHTDEPHQNHTATIEEFPVTDMSFEQECRCIHISDVISYLRWMPNLEVLNVSDPDDVGRLIQFLTTPGSDGTFPVPKLRRLSLIHDGYWNDSLGWNGSWMDFQRRYEGVPSMVCQIPTPLETISVDDDSIRLTKEEKSLFKKHGTKFVNEHY